MFGRDKYDKKFPDVERDYSGGVAKYVRKKSEIDKLLQDQSDPRNAKAIAELKKRLEEAVNAQAAQRRAVFRQTADPKSNKILTGRELKARDYDARQTTNDIERIIRQLARFGVKVNHNKAAGRVSYRNMNEGGQSTMVYDVTRLKQMKLETFQESAAGTITKEATDYLLKYFDMMIEAAKAEGTDMNDLVTDYIAACKDNDDDKKEDLKKQISAATGSKQAKEELETLKEKLSDKEKAFVEELDAEICGSKCDDKGKGSECGEEPVEESGEESEDGASAKDSANAAEEMGKKIKAGTEKAGKDNAEAFDQLLSAASESALTDAGQGALLDYVTESVATGDMDVDVALAITNLMTL